MKYITLVLIGLFWFSNATACYDENLSDKENFKNCMIEAKDGNELAQLFLGTMYDNGQGVPQDYKEAMKWYRKSAEQGDASAQLNLGTMYGNGQGIPQDYVMAHFYLNIAGANGITSAIKGRDIVEKKMSHQQIEEAQKLVREWMEEHQ